MPAVSVVTDDRFWDEDLFHFLPDRFDPTEWLYEVKSYLGDGKPDEAFMFDPTPSEFDTVAVAGKPMARHVRRRTTVLRRRHHGSKTYGYRDDYQHDPDRRERLALVADAEISVSVLEHMDKPSELDLERVAELVIMYGIETEQRVAREAYTDIHAKRRFLKDLIEDLERRAANGTSAGNIQFLIECQTELCELESVLRAA